MNDLDHLIDSAEYDAIYGEDDYLAWQEAMDQYEGNRDALDAHWDQVVADVEGEYFDNQPRPW